MDQPLGNEVGNANEIIESIKVLRGEGPEDLVEVTLALGVEMLAVAGRRDRSRVARGRLQQTINDGSALETLAKVIEAQGGDPNVIDDFGLLPKAPHRTELVAEATGYISGLDALKVGVAAMRLGAGRERKEDTIDPSVGITVGAQGRRSGRGGRADPHPGLSAPGSPGGSNGCARGRG